MTLKDTSYIVLSRGEAGDPERRPRATQVTHAASIEDQTIPC